MITYSEIGIREGMVGNKIICKYCGSSRINKYGQYNGVPRYFCKSCRRKFKADNAAFHMKVPAEYVITALDMYYRSTMIREIRDCMRELYNYYPSKSGVYQWIRKYSAFIMDRFNAYRPEVGDLWLTKETDLEIDGRHQVWIYDVLDIETGFLLVTSVTLSPGQYKMEWNIKKAAELAGKKPREVIFNGRRSLSAAGNKIFEADQVSMYNIPSVNECFDLADRFIGTLRGNPFVLPFKYVDTLHRYVNGWRMYYNFFKTNRVLGGKTPAEAAKIDYDVKSWADIVLYYNTRRLH